MTLQAAQTNESTMREKELAPFLAGRGELAEFASRLKQALSYRGAEKLTNVELLALAAASRAHGLNPFMGEIWAIPGKGLMVGRAGWVKKINEKLDNRGIRWWPQYLEVREHEREQYGIPKSAKLAFICELRRADQIETYLSALERLQKLGITGNEAIEMLGRPPVIRGIGYIKEDEKLEGYMSFGERCKKRAFAQACKEIIDLPFAAFSEGDVVDGLVLDGPEDAPDVSVMPEPEVETVEGEAHWAEDAQARKRFWRFTKTDMQLTEDEAHEALGVAHLRDYGEGEEQAYAVLRAYTAAKYGQEPAAEVA